MLQLPKTQESFEIFADVLHRQGVRESLAYLVSLTDYRFIAIFRFDGDKANAAVYVDRDNPDVLGVDEAPAGATYCCYVRDSRGVFSTADAMSDPRVIDHVARDVVMSYCGVPVMTAEGEILGTLCYYDRVPRDPNQVDLMLILQVASLLGRSGLVPPYPQAAAKRPSPGLATPGGRVLPSWLPRATSLPNTAWAVRGWTASPNAPPSTSACSRLLQQQGHALPRRAGRSLRPHPRGRTATAPGRSAICDLRFATCRRGAHVDRVHLELLPGAPRIPDPVEQREPAPRAPPAGVQSL